MIVSTGNLKYVYVLIKTLTFSQTSGSYLKVNLLLAVMK